MSPTACPRDTPETSCRVAQKSSLETTAAYPRSHQGEKDAFAQAAVDFQQVVPSVGGSLDDKRLSSFSRLVVTSREVTRFISLSMPTVCTFLFFLFFSLFYDRLERRRYFQRDCVRTVCVILRERRRERQEPPLQYHSIPLLSFAFA